MIYRKYPRKLQAYRRSHDGPDLPGVSHDGPAGGHRPAAGAIGRVISNMKQPEQALYLVMDESDAPYEEGEYTRTPEDDMSIVRLAKKCGLEFIPGTDLDRLYRSVYGDS